MKTYGLPLSATKFQIVYLEQNSVQTASFVYNFSQQATIILFDTTADALEWLQAGNQTDLVIANSALGGMALLEKLHADGGSCFLPVILTAKTVTPELQENAYRLQALEVFSLESDTEKLKFRVAYLIQKKAYFNSSNQLADLDLPKAEMPFWKRLLDVVVSLSVLTALSPILIVAAMLIYIESPGPVLYRSKRVGRDFKVFNMYKFRSMRLNADKLLSGMAAHNIYSSAEPAIAPNARCENCQRLDVTCQNPLFLQGTLICEREHLRAKKAEAVFVKFRNDPRITRLGSILRNSSIDELPQLFNILRGDMSLVGNRPLPFYEAERLTMATSAQRFAAPAGLTGLWQVTKRGKSHGVVTDLERVQLDIKYAEHFSFRTDLDILLKTVTAVWQRENV